MITWPSRTDQSALEVLARCATHPADSELLPLLALSVLATGGPFSAALVGSQAAEAAASLEAAGRSAAADSLIAQCAASLQRCGAGDTAADLRESITILRWKSMRAARSAQNPAWFDQTDDRFQ